MISGPPPAGEYAEKAGLVGPKAAVAKGGVVYNAKVGQKICVILQFIIKENSGPVGPKAAVAKGGVVYNAKVGFKCFLASKFSARFRDDPKISAARVFTCWGDGLPKGR